MPGQNDAPWGVLEIARSLAAVTRVEKCTIPRDQWMISDGVLRHVTAPFFEVAGFTAEDGSTSILLRQDETALAGLIICRVDGERHYLLNARCEPGLHGRCQFSTTVQSTPSNYQRRHGGASTPFIDLFLAPESPARVIHDSLEYDWGQYYDRKRKRFLVIEVQDCLDADLPCVWIAESEVDRMLEADYSVTADLRSAIALVRAHDSGERASLPGGIDLDPAGGSELSRTPLAELDGWIIDDFGIREATSRQGVTVEYVHTESKSREVTSWSQPLLRVDDSLTVTLVVRSTTGEEEVAVETGTQLGLAGHRLFFPATTNLSGLAIERRVRTSAEGGRFLEHEVVLQLARSTEADDDGVTWLTHAQLAQLILVPEVTSVELRLAVTLLDRAAGGS